jgi:hypothetical protein
MSVSLRPSPDKIDGNDAVDQRKGWDNPEFWWCSQCRRLRDRARREASASPASRHSWRACRSGIGSTPQSLPEFDHHLARELAVLGRLNSLTAAALIGVLLPEVTWLTVWPLAGRLLGPVATL